MNVSYRSNLWIDQIKKYIFFIAVFPACLILIPKIDLINIGSGTPLRIDDIILLGVTLVLFAYALKYIQYITKIEAVFFFFVLVCFFSNLINYFLFDRSNILFSIRYIEYFVFFYSGYLYSKRTDIPLKLQKLLEYYLWITLVLVLVQVFARPLHSFLPYFIHSKGVVTGLTAGPWEVGATLNILFSVFAFDKETNRKKVFVIFFVSTYIIVLSGSRSPLLAHFILFSLYLYKFPFFNNRIVFFIFYPAVIFIIYILFVGVDLQVKNRSGNLISYDNIEIFTDNYNRIFLTPFDRGFDNISISNETNRDIGDTSWALRSMKWAYAIKLWHSSYLTIMFGVGPGTFGQAVDGSLVRILTEIGVIGFISYLNVLLYLAFKVHYVLKYIVLALLINMIMIDSHNAYKIMSMFFFSVGFYTWKSKE